MTDAHPPVTDGHWHHICDGNELSGTQCREFLVADTPGFAFRHQGEVRAFINRCPHLGIELNWMPDRFFDLEQTFIQCSTHGALFLPQTGHCIAGPCAGEHLAALPVREQNGRVEVCVNPD